MSASNLSPSQSPRTPVIQVFGLLHLTFGILGILFAGLFLVSMAFQEKITEWSFTVNSNGSSAEEVKAMQEIMMTFNKAVQPLTLYSSASLFLLGLILIISGRKLIKSQKAGLKWSNRYAWLSILSKIVLAAFSVSIMYRHLPPYMTGMMSLEAGGLPQQEMDEIMEVIIHFTVLGTALFYLATCLYPILALILLNKKTAVSSFEEN